MSNSSGTSVSSSNSSGTSVSSSNSSGTTGSSGNSGSCTTGCNGSCSPLLVQPFIGGGNFHGFHRKCGNEAAFVSREYLLQVNVLPVVNPQSTEGQAHYN